VLALKPLISLTKTWHGPDSSPGKQGVPVLAAGEGWKALVAVVGKLAELVVPAT
jgi:hypothetical protein